MRPRIIQETNTIAFASAGNINQKLGPLPFVLRGIILEQETAYTVSAGAASQDWLARQIASLQITGGTRNYLSWSGARDLRSLYWLNQFRLRHTYRMPDYSNNSVTAYWQLPLIFDPNPFDAKGRLKLLSDEPLVAGIPRDADLSITGTWAANSVLGTTGVTTGAGTVLRIHYLAAILEPGDPEPQYYPAWEVQVPTINGTSSGLGTEIDMVTNAWIRRANFMQLVGSVTNQADVRYAGYGSSGISELGVSTTYSDTVKAKFKTLERLYQGAKQVAADNAFVTGSSATLAPAASIITDQTDAGVVGWDWLDFARSDSAGDATVMDPNTGLNQNNKDPNAVQIKATTDSTTNLHVEIAHEAYKQLAA